MHRTMCYLYIFYMWVLLGMGFWTQNTSFNCFWIQWHYVKLQEQPLIVDGRQLMSQYGWIPQTLWEILSIQYLVTRHVGSEGWILLGCIVS